MVLLRPVEDCDSEAVGLLIARTFGEFNLAYASPEERERLLGPFRHAGSGEDAHRREIAAVIRASIMWVAVSDGEIVGVLRGRKERLQSLFVSRDFQRQGIGRRLVQTFEDECLLQGTTAIRVASSLFAVPFYQKLGYRKTTGVRSGTCFDGDGFPRQPMIKRFTTAHARSGERP